MNSFTYTPYFAFHSSKCKKSQHLLHIPNKFIAFHFIICKTQKNLLPFATFLGAKNKKA
jgi:hypothetical protein